MANVSIGFASNERQFAGLPPVVLKNRFFEETPTQALGTAMLARPGTLDLASFGASPIRSIYSLPGLFNGALFYVAGRTLFRRDVDGTTTIISGIVLGTGRVSMTGLAGAGFERLFVADGTLLQVYQGGTHASGVLTAVAQVSDGELVNIGETNYRFVSTLAFVDGSSVHPWQVKIGTSLSVTLGNLVQAISFTGTPGQDFSDQLDGPHPEVTAQQTPASSGIIATSRATDPSGNAIVTTETGLDMAWSAGTLTGGGVDLGDGTFSHATGTLSVTAQPADGDVVRIGSVFYQFKTNLALFDGSAGNPWEILIGPDAVGSINNLVQAISFSGIPGTAYSQGLGGQNTEVSAAAETVNVAYSGSIVAPHPDVSVSSDASTMTATALATGVAGNAIVTAETGLNMAWGAETLTGGTDDPPVAATGVLTASAQVALNDTVRIGSRFYRWVSSVIGGAGTESEPWQVVMGATLAESLANMVNAINFTGGTFEVRMTTKAKVDLTAGNLITTTETGANLSWGSVTLTGGGSHALSGVSMPDGLPPLAVGTLKSFIVIAVAKSDRFYFLTPGQLVIDPLNFATAESQPDDVVDLVIVGDSAWFIGQGSTEVWYATGSASAPFSPANGRVFDQGAIEGTVVNVKGTPFLVGSDFVVYAVSGGPRRVSSHGVEEMIRKTIGAE